MTRVYVSCAPGAIMWLPCPSPRASRCWCVSTPKNLCLYKDLPQLHWMLYCPSDTHPAGSSPAGNEGMGVGEVE